MKKAKIMFYSEFTDNWTDKQILQLMLQQIKNALETEKPVYFDKKTVWVDGVRRSFKVSTNDCITKPLKRKAN